MTRRHILRNILLETFCIALNKLYQVIINRKLQHIVHIPNFMAPGPLGHYAFLHRINTSGAKNKPLLNFKKQRTCKGDIAKVLAISNAHYLELSLSQSFSLVPSAFLVYIWYLEPCYLKLSLCQTNFSVPSAPLSRYLELFHLDNQFLKKIVRKL